MNVKDSLGRPVPTGQCELCLTLPSICGVTCSSVTSPRNAGFAVLGCYTLHLGMQQDGLLTWDPRTFSRLVLFVSIVDRCFAVSHRFLCSFFFTCTQPVFCDYYYDMRVNERGW